MNNYQEAERFLFERLPMFQRVGGAAYKKDLSNTFKLLERLNHPQKKTQYVHVAGTNGKGSTSSMIASILMAAGYKVGLYTSPHLKHFNERIRINGKAIPEESILHYVTAYQPLIEEIAPSFFELTTAMAFEYFADENVDIAIMEVGLGGRLDSTNVITPLVAVITQIDYDHQQFLGDTLEEIATEKAGIIKPTIPIVSAVAENDLQLLISGIAKKRNAPYIFAGDHYDCRLDGFQNGFFNYRVTNLVTQQINLIKSDQGGIYQAYNLKTVLTTLDQLKVNNGFEISENAITEGLQHVKEYAGLKGRWQVFKPDENSPKVIADTGHNESAVKLIVEMLSHEVYDKLHIVWGAVNDKSIEPILKLLPKTASYYFTKADVPRALDPKILAKKSLEFGLKGEIFESVALAFNAAKENSSKNDIIFVGGSTFVVAELPILD